MSMACSSKWNKKQKDVLSTMDPRISFSNDFAEAQMAIKSESNYREAPVSSDFQFSVKKYRMIAADEVMFKGMLVPVKENCSRMTLRDELLVDDDDHEDALSKLPKNSCWWKERLGLNKSRNNDKNPPPKTTGEME